MLSHDIIPISISNQFTSGVMHTNTVLQCRQKSPCSAYNLIWFQCRQIDAVSKGSQLRGPFEGVYQRHVYIHFVIHALITQMVKQNY